MAKSAAFRAQALALLLLHALCIGAPAPGDVDFLESQPQEPRRTFCSVGRDKRGTRIYFILPFPHTAVNAGPLQISVSVRGDSEVAKNGRVVLYVDAPTHRPVLMQATSSGEPGERRLSATVDVQTGSHTLQAALLDADGVQTGAVAFTSFMARGPDFDLEQAARKECRGEKVGTTPSKLNLPAACTIGPLPQLSRLHHATLSCGD